MHFKNFLKATLLILCVYGQSSLFCTGMNSEGPAIMLVSNFKQALAFRKQIVDLKKDFLADKTALEVSDLYEQWAAQEMSRLESLNPSSLTRDQLYQAAIPKPGEDSEAAQHLQHQYDAFMRKVAILQRQLMTGQQSHHVASELLSLYTQHNELNAYENDLPHRAIRTFFTQPVFQRTKLLAGNIVGQG